MVMVVADLQGARGEAPPPLLIKGKKKKKSQKDEKLAEQAKQNHPLLPLPLSPRSGSANAWERLPP